MRRACQKRPVSQERIDEMATRVERRLQESGEKEVAASAVGELVMDLLRAEDPVAYVRFASVYRDFKDLPDFVKALEGLMGGPPPLQPVLPPPVPPRISEASQKPKAAQPIPLFPGVDPDSPPSSRRRKPK
jgi:transcriptional repressor NrdR